jgi:molybdenum-dependent DNA-binding transcriptional regulator ModE
MKGMGNRPFGVAIRQSSISTRCVRASFSAQAVRKMRTLTEPERRYILRKKGAAMLHGRMLRYVDEVARSGSIRKAAIRLNVSASSINRQILSLEAELETPIFERMPSGLRLTATGEILIAHVRETMREHQGRLDAWPP